MKLPYFLGLTLCFVTTLLGGQTLGLELDSIYTNPDGQVEMNLRVDTTFNQMRGAQFSIRWNPEVVAFQAFDAKINGFLINDRQQEEGVIGLVWNLEIGENLDIENQASILAMTFDVIGDPGDSSLVMITNAPVADIFVGCCGTDESSPIFPLKRYDYTVKTGWIKIVEALNVSAEIPSATCANEPVESFAPNVSGGVPPYRFQWSGPNQFQSEASELNNILPGIYRLTLTDQFGLSIDTTYTIDSPEPLSANIITTPSRCDRPSGAILANPIGGTPDYSFNINGNTPLIGEFSGLSPGTYQLQIFDANSCQLDTMVVIAERTPELIEVMVSDTALCEGEPAFLSINASPQDAIEWRKDNQLLEETGQSFSVLESGTYEARIVNEFGCTSQDSATVSFLTAPPQDFILEDTVQRCLGETVTIQSQLGEDVELIWNTGETGRTISFTKSGVYFAEAIASSGCSASDTLTVAFEVPPRLNLPERVELCTGDTVQIGVAAESNVRYQWSTGENTPLISVQNSDLFTLLATSSNGCSSADSVNVEVIEPLQAELDNVGDLFCEGEMITLTARGGDFYQWIDTSGTLRIDQDNPHVASLAVEQNLEFSVVIGNSCALDTLFQQIQVTPVDATAMPDTCIGKGSSIQLEAFGGISYVWQNDTFPVSDPQISNPMATPEVATTYIVDIVDENGCMITDSVYVAVADDPLAFIKPVNFITPNNDGFNDYLEFDQLFKYDKVKLSVFNRWGDKVYEKLDYQKDGERWDGQYKGKPLPEGAYFYLLEVNDSVIRQSITLIR